MKKVRVNFALGQAMKAQRYSSARSLTSALDEGGWLTPRPSSFTPVKETRYPLYMRLGGPKGWSGLVRNISPGIRSPESPTLIEPLYQLSYSGPLSQPLVNYNIQVIRTNTILKQQLCNETCRRLYVAFYVLTVMLA